MNRRVALVLLVAACGLLFVSLVEAHSWVACADYRITNQKDADYYNNDACFGFARNFKEFDRGFGVDAGYDYSIPADGDTPNSCPTRAPRQNPVSASYTDKYPMPRYTPGQEVCLAWPSKNHVAATCTNQYIPDGGVKIFLSSVNPTSDPTQLQFEKNMIAELPKHQNGVMDFKGYQNCSKFCENTDKSLCIGCFQLPANVQAGLYTMQWYWIFNPGQAYTTCIDVQIGAGGGSTGGGSTGGGSTGGSTTGGSTTGGGSSGSDSGSGSVTLSQDTFLVTKAPSTFKSSEPFTVSVKYNAAGPRQLVVDILSIPDYKWYGKGNVPLPKGTGAVDVTVTPQNDPPKYKNYVFKVWIVDQSEYTKNPAEAYTFELTREEIPATCGDTVVYANSDDVTSGSSSKGGIMALLFFSGMVAAAIIAGVILFVLSRKNKTGSTTTDYRLFGKDGNHV